MTDNRTIALDAMGGDFGPAETVRGAVLAAAKGGVSILLVGDERAVKEELDRSDASSLPIQVVPSEGVIVEGEHPARALMSKPGSSIAVCAGLVKEGKADAFLSAGNTGAVMLGARVVLGPIKGVARSAICQILPTTSGILGQKNQGVQRGNSDRSQHQRSNNQ